MSTPIDSNIKLNSGALIHPDYLHHAKRSFLAESQVDEFLNYCGKPLRQSIRINRLKTTQESFQKIAQDYHWQLTPIPWCEDGFWIDTSNSSLQISLGNIPEHILGLFYIQEASSMLPPMALFAGESLTDLKNPMIMDMAAAPGSKTTQIAATLNNQGILLANELSASRIKSLYANLIRCGVSNTCIANLNAVKLGNLLPNSFDFILLDAPCSGEGTIRKDHNALKDWSYDKVKTMAELQKQLILSAYQSLKPGGKLVYSTCTLSLEENHQVADYLVETTDAKINSLHNLFPGSDKITTEQGYLHLMPHHFDNEGFFVASFNKPIQPNNQQQEKPVFRDYNQSYKLANKKDIKQLSEYYQQRFAINIQDGNNRIYQRENSYWLFPHNLDKISQHIKLNRSGIKLAQIFPNKIRTNHEFVCCFGNQAEKNYLALNTQEFEAFIRGNNLIIEDHTKISSGEIILQYKNQAIGLGQYQKGKIKNGLSRDLVKDNYKSSSD